MTAATWAAEVMAAVGAVALARLDVMIEWLVMTQQLGGGIEPLSPLAQAGVLGSLLIIFGVVIRTLFAKMIASKDAEIAAANRAREAAEASRDRFEQKLDAQQQKIQDQVIAALSESSITTRKALEITQRERP